MAFGCVFRKSGIFAVCKNGSWMFELFAGAGSDISVWKSRGVIVCLGWVRVGSGELRVIFEEL